MLRVEEITRKLEDAVAERDRLIALLTTLVTLTKKREIVIKLTDIEKAYDNGESITIWAPDEPTDKRVVILRATLISKEKIQKRRENSIINNSLSALFDPSRTEIPD